MMGVPRMVESDSLCAGAKSTGPFEPFRGKEMAE